MTLAHISISLWLSEAMPGVVSSPLLLAVSGYLLFVLRRGR